MQPDPLTPCCFSCKESETRITSFNATPKVTVNDDFEVKTNWIHFRANWKYKDRKLINLHKPNHNNPARTPSTTKTATTSGAGCSSELQPTPGDVHIQPAMFAIHKARSKKIIINNYPRVEIESRRSVEKLCIQYSNRCNPTDFEAHENVQLSTILLSRR
jgi:hypothetical protein